MTGTLSIELNTNSGFSGRSGVSRFYLSSPTEPSLYVYGSFYDIAHPTAPGLENAIRGNLFGLEENQLNYGEAQLSAENLARARMLSYRLVDSQPSL